MPQPAALVAWRALAQRWWRADSAAPGLTPLQIAQLQNRTAFAGQREVEQICRQICVTRPALALVPLAAHANGFVRAAVMQAMSEQPVPQQIAAIVGRLNDWVPVVRLQAAMALRAHLRTPFLLPCLMLWPQLRRLHHCRREVHRHLVLEVEQFLLAKAHHASLCAALRAALAQPASRAGNSFIRECMRLVVQAELLPTASLLEMALTANDRQIVGCFPAWVCELPSAQRLPWLLRGVQARQTVLKTACFAQLSRLAQLPADDVQRQAARALAACAQQWQHASCRRLRHLSRNWLAAQQAVAALSPPLQEK